MAVDLGAAGLTVIGASSGVGRGRPTLEANEPGGRVPGRQKRRNPLHMQVGREQSVGPEATRGSRSVDLKGASGMSRGAAARGARGSAAALEAGVDRSASLSVFGAAAQAEATATLVSGEGSVAAQSPSVGPATQRLGLQGQVEGEAFGGGTASASASAGWTGVEAGVDAFAGGRVGGSASGGLVWEKDDTTAVLRDYADNLPGNWDDALLDRVPDEVFSAAARALFGEGSVRLLQAGVGAEAHAGVGVGAGVSAGAGQDGLLSLGASAGASAGVGASVKAELAANPRELLRFAVLRGMADTNKVVGALEAAWRHIQGR